MAVSDPNPDVPTPTGTLLGVAAFAWDGTAWQPSAAAGAFVPTPTGALRGVAPFAWGGAAWQPAGRASPDVPTPRGTLDGVAVYQWNGTAWAPSGAGASVPTPYGTLQGVAAFYWDGAAWQPSGRAGASVPTPTGTLQGVAMFGWSGSAWAPAPALDLGFLGGALDSRISFTRASTATYFNAAGTMQTAAVNVPRFDYDPVTHQPLGLLVEELRINSLLNSATLGTQSVTVTAAPWTLSFWGTGTVTLTGASTAGPLVGTGANNRVTLTFTPTAGALTCTVTGSVTNAQLELGAFATSYIPTTGSTATRAADVPTVATSGWFSAAAGTLAVETQPFGWVAGSTRNACTANLDDGTTNGTNEIKFFHYMNGATFVQPNVLVTAAGVQTGSLGGTNINTSGAPIVKAAYAYTGSALVLANNGAIGNSGALTGFPATISRLMLSGVNWGGLSPNIYLRRVRFWPRALSNAELQQVTT